MCLWELELGHKGIIMDIDSSCGNRQRLNELGFTVDTEIVPLYKSLSGNLTAYWVKGTVMALRKEDADYIKVYGREGQL